MTVKGNAAVERITRLPATKFIAIGCLTLLLLVPTMLVWGLVEERADRAREVGNDIANAWGQQQSVVGPVLAVPFVTRIPLADTGKNDEPRFRVSRSTVFLFPESLDITADARVEERHRSIFKLPVFRGAIDLKGRFAPATIDPDSLSAEGAVTLLPMEAFVVIGIGDVRAIKNDVAMRINGGAPRPFAPGPGGNERAGRGSRGSAIHLPVSESEWRGGFSFATTLALNGSRAISFAPAGQSTTLAMTSDWPHPGFAGRYLPDTRDIRDDGFSARWSVPYLARGVASSIVAEALPIDASIEVNFVDPLSIYQTVARALKYAVAFFGLTFMAVFVLELRSGWRLHWIQYLLVGFALVVFFVLLLALTEQVGFAWAYLIAFLATTTLVGAYVGSATGSRASGAITAAALTVVYGVLYLILNDQDYALLAGAIVAFVALAATMLATRNVDWSGGAPAPVDAPLEGVAAE
ncbi:cell envelope integrity protein CreD [Breoghania sp. L-A4]|uniref:cell envelope integrity protein CreD n=1 Tax=Breoghania sp. L-A4 TaxID=2304600 RepID=UPI0013C2FA2A|nr:cell envelope integrity protein CreD [Breoghania sp. L-A4]